MVDLAIVGGHVAELTEALPVTHLDSPTGRTGEDTPANADVADPVRTVEDHPLDPCLFEPRHQNGGSQHGAVRQLADAPGEGLVPDEDAEQWLGHASTRWNGHRSPSHLHQGVGPALGRRAGKGVRADGVAQAVAALGPVGREQLLLDASQGPSHNGAVDGIEEAVESPSALECS